MAMMAEMAPELGSMLGEGETAGIIGQGASAIGSQGSATNAATAMLDQQAEMEQAIGKVLQKLDQVITALINDIS